MIDTRDISLILLESCWRASSLVYTVVLPPLEKPAYCHCSHSQVLITGAELVVRMGYEQVMNKTVSTLRTGSEKLCLLLKGEGGGEDDDRKVVRKKPQMNPSK